MAKALKRCKTVKKMVAVKVKEEKIVLTLDLEEAKVLRELTGSIFGSACSTYRNVTSNIYNALGNVGIASVGVYFPLSASIPANKRVKGNKNVYP